MRNDITHRIIILSEYFESHLTCIVGEAPKSSMKQNPNSPLCGGSLLSTFLSADTMASEGIRGLSTYLGFLIGPVGVKRRRRERETVWDTQRETKEERNGEKGSCGWINVFQMGLHMRSSGVLGGQAWLHSHTHAWTHTLLQTVRCTDCSSGLSDSHEYGLHGWRLPVKQCELVLGM